MKQSELVLDDVGVQIAVALCVRYDGVQRDSLGLVTGFMFTDLETGTTFMGKDAVTATARLDKVRADFAGKGGGVNGNDC